MRSNKRLTTTSFIRPPLASLSSTAPTSAYIHLPFCAQRCAYCAFPVIVSGRSVLPDIATKEHPPPPQAHHDYVDLLCREIRTVASRWHSLPERSAPRPLSTLYLGGGTPSLLHPSLLQRVIETVRDAIGLSSDAELTCEMDPATFTLRTAEAYRHLGVNRASVGAQSFDNDLLSACRRVHKRRDIEEAVSALRDAGFANISLDLISGLPGQTMDTWRASLDAALRVDPEHISSYDLMLEPGTHFGNKYEPGEGPLPTEALAAEMMNISAAVLRDAHFEHYEVSNFAKRDLRVKLPNRAGTHRPLKLHKSPFRSKHNMAYWQNEAFYAFGLGATSVLDGFRFARPRRLSAYVEYVNGLEQIAGLTSESEEGDTQWKHVTEVFYPNMKPLNERERLEDYLINAFRLLVEGVNLEELRLQFGPPAWERLVTAIEKCDSLERQGFIRVERSMLEQYPTSVRLTEQGALIENTVLSTLLHEAVWRVPVQSETLT